MAAEFVQRGRLCVEQGHLQEAVRVCRLGLLANPGEVEGRVVLGSALMALARFDEVLGEMRSALEMEPANPSALALQGEALLRKGDGVRAVAVLEQAAMVAPGDPYVEQLRIEASMAAANGPSPLQTVDIDPELEGVEIREEDVAPMEVSADDFIEEEPDIEELDADLLTEATPTPMPYGAALPAPGGYGEEGPFEDIRGARLPEQPYEPAPEVIPMFDAPTPDPPTPEFHEMDPPTPELPRRASSDFEISDMDSGGPVLGRPATIGTLFPDDEPGDSEFDYLAQTPAPTAQHADMDMIRHGFSAPSPASREPRMMAVPAMSAPPPVAQPPQRNERRRETATAGARSGHPAGRRAVRKIPRAAWAALALLAMAGGAGGGLKLREARLARQVRTANEQIQSLVREDGYLGHRKARDWVARIHKVRGTDDSLARLAAAEALLAGEFGEDAGRAEALLAKVKTKELPAALEASAYVALAHGDEANASRNAKLLIDGNPKSSVGHYLLARAMILAADGEAAKSAIDKAIEIVPSLSAYVVLAQAEALRSRFPEALAAMGRASGISAEHPQVLIWQARILLEAGELPKNPSDPDDSLSDVITRSRNSAAVSPVQGAWAGLVLAEIKLQRGDVAAAKMALAEAKVGRPSGWMFSEMLTDVLIRLGELEQALAEAQRASEAWPNRAKPRIARALIRLMQDDPNAALEVLEEVQGIDTLAEALAVRGRAQLRLGQLDLATTDLDRALTLRPRFAAAVIARANVDILRGRAKAAIGRLEPMYDRTAGAELAVAYAAALRTSGKSREAREVLTPLADADGTLIAVIELARLEHFEGRVEEARKVYARAIDMDPHSVEAQLGSAELDIDDGRVKEGREALDALVAKGTRSGPVLLACARARTLTGDTEGAKELLDQVDAAWLGWKVARERGRILLNRLTPIEALSELQRAQSLRPDDVETLLLLMEAHFEAGNQRGSARALEEITKRFPNAPLRASAAGLHALLTDRPPDAIAAFSEARSLLIDKGSRLELAQVAYWLGRSYEYSGDLRQAAQWLDKATKLNDAHALAYYWAGQIYHQEQKPDKMVSSYEQAVALDPGIAPMAWYFLGSNYAAAGKKDDAVRALEKFLQYYPENSGDMVVEAKVMLGQLR